MSGLGCSLTLHLTNDIHEISQRKFVMSFVKPYEEILNNTNDLAMAGGREIWAYPKKPKMVFCLRSSGRLPACRRHSQASWLAHR